MSETRELVTPEALGKCRMQGQMFLDCEDSYTNVYQCIEHPALTKTASGPAGRSLSEKGKRHTVTWRVDGHEVPFDKQAICDAFYAAKKEAP